MEEIEQKQAVAEGILERLRKREWHQLDLLIAQTGDTEFWAEVLRYELSIESLSTGILKDDKVLQKLAEFNVQSMSAFHYAGIRGAERVIRKGLQFRLNVDVRLGDGVTVLHLASFAGKLETVVQLIDEFKADVNAEDRRSWRPLHYACAMGHTEVVQFLIKRGADIGARDTEGATAAYRARENRHEAIVSTLMDFYRDGDILLVEQVECRQSTTPVYAALSRKEVTSALGRNEDRQNDSGTESSEELGRRAMANVQRKDKIQLKPVKRQGLKIDYEEVDLPREDKTSSVKFTTVEELANESNIENGACENSNKIEHLAVSDSKIRAPNDSELPEDGNKRCQEVKPAPKINSKTRQLVNSSGVRTDFRPAVLPKTTATKFKSDYEDIDLVQCNNSSSENTKIVENPNGSSELRISDDSKAPVVSGNVQNLRKKFLGPDYEEIDLVEDTNSQTVLSNGAIGSQRPKRPLKPRATSGKAVKVPPTRYQPDLGLYEELPEDDSLITETTENTKCGAQSGLSKISTNKTNVDAGTEIAHICPSGYTKRPHPYEEIEFPEDSDQQLGTTEENQLMRERSNGILSTKPDSKDLCEARGPHEPRRKPRLYDEIGLQSDEFLPYELDESKIENLLRDRGTANVSDSKRIAFHRRPHHYEELEFPTDVGSNTEPLDNEELETRVRCLLRTELENLVVVPSNCNKNLNMVKPSRPTSGFIREFFKTEEFCDEAGRKVQNSSEDLVTIRQLRRLLREEIARLTENMFPVAVSKDFSNECLENLKMFDDSNSDSTSGNNVDPESGKNAISVDNMAEHLNRDEEETAKPEVRSLQHTQSTPSTSAKPLSSLEQKPLDKSFSSMLCSPGLFRMALFDRKKEKADQADNSQLQPNGRPAPSIKPDEMKPDPNGNDQTGQNPKQSGTNSSRSQSQFYVTLDDDELLKAIEEC